jgi:hypothetical protein
MCNDPIPARKNDDGTYTLCEDPPDCCPIVTPTEEGYQVVDDNGGKVSLSHREAIQFANLVLERKTT